MRPSANILADYLAGYLASPVAQQWMKDRYVGTDMPRINVEHARTIPVPLPPPPEQREIVRRVAALFALADSIEAKVTAARAKADALTQAVLAKAFRGELVPTEAELARRDGRDYEPASALLERVRAERAAAPKQRPKRKA
jgi:type I restriction enzyme S subunit